MKRMIAFAAMLSVLFCLSACGGHTEQQGNETTGQSNQTSQFKSPSLDGDIGLKNVKVDTNGAELSEKQKTILKYFGQDCFAVDYEFLQRYPQIYEGAEISVSGQVKKVLSSTADTFEILLWDVKDHRDYFYWSGNDEESSYDEYLQENTNRLLVVTGQQGEARLVDGDWVNITGRLQSIDPYTIDGTSYTLPTVTSNKTLIRGTEEEAFSQANYKFIKQVACAFFGDDVEVRKPTPGVDVDEACAWLALEDGEDTDPFYIVELEDQSNAKFGKYRIFLHYPRIEDAKSASDQYWVLSENDNIQRMIEISADFAHYILFSYDRTLNNLTVEYYDLDFNKIWKREFAQTSHTTYDYTATRIYLVANNNLYILDAETGEDATSPSYIGEKAEIRKLSDGILMLSWDATDAIMKTDNNGNVLWKLGLDESINWWDSIQAIDKNLVFQFYSSQNDIQFLMVDGQTGELKLQAKHITSGY